MMLRIRDEQIAAMRGAAEATAELRREAAIRDAWPEATRSLDAGALRARVVRARERAAARGFVDPAHALRWVHLSFAAGERFDEETDWAPVILGWGADAERTLAALEDAAAASAT